MLQLTKMSYQRRNLYTVEFKTFVVDWLRRNDGCIHKAAREFNIDRKRVREWDRKYNELQRMNVGAKAKRRKLCTGRFHLSWINDCSSSLRKKDRRVDHCQMLVCKPRLLKLVLVYVSVGSNQVLDGYDGGRGEMVWGCGAVQTVLRKFQLTMPTSFITSGSL